MFGISPAGREVAPGEPAAILAVALPAIALSVALSLAAPSAWAQEHKGEAGASPPDSPAGTTAPPPAGSPPDPGYRPGFIDALGHFVGDSAAKLNSQLKSAGEALGVLGNQTSGAAKGAVGAAKDAVDTARDAAGSIAGFPNTHVVTGHERCGTAANGAPDCRAAADATCRGKGFASGRSLDTESSQTCSARALLSGRSPADGGCFVETFVTRAVCQ